MTEGGRQSREIGERKIDDTEQSRDGGAVEVAIERK
jgi:hypothetical protein